VNASPPSELVGRTLLKLGEPGSACTGPGTAVGAGVALPDPEASPVAWAVA